MLTSSIVVVTLLSVSAAAEDVTRCRWCGPLAEQVHRSQRAPPCDEFEQHETLCDPEFTHCAIVATSPPYAESRLCVKFYQDECYSLYCNSTKSWRMICTCRGNLCNGAHTERETRAFATLQKIVGKTITRTKRTLQSGFISVKTKQPSGNNTIIIISNKTIAKDETVNSNQGDQQTHDPTENNVANSTMVANDAPKTVEENTMIEIVFSSTVLGLPPKNGEHKMSDATSALPGYDISHEVTQMDEVSTTMGAMAGTSYKGIMAVTPLVEDTTTVEFVKITEVPMETSMKPTSIEVELDIIKKHAKPNYKLPPAEALQQNITPTKAVEHSTMRTVVMSTENNHFITETTTPSKPMKKNDGTQNVSSTSGIIVSITLVLKYYLKI